MELPNLALNFTFSTVGQYFIQTLPKKAKNILKNVKKDAFCFECLRNENSRPIKNYQVCSAW